MDSCDLTGNDPAWSVQHAISNTPKHSGSTGMQQANDHPQPRSQPLMVSQTSQLHALPQSTTASNNSQADLCSYSSQQHPAGYAGNDSSSSRSTSSWNTSRQPSPGVHAWPACNNNTSNGPSGTCYNQSAPQGPRSTGYNAGGGNSYMQQEPRSMMSNDGPWGTVAGRGRGQSSNSYSSRSAHHTSAEAGSWGSTRSDSAVGGYQGGHRAGISNRYQQHSSSYSNLRSGSPGYNTCNIRMYNQIYGNRDYADSGGRGSGRVYGSRSSSPGFGAGRRPGPGGFRPGSGGQGPVAPCWVRQGCWLVRRPHSSSGPPMATRSAGQLAELAYPTDNTAASPADGNSQLAPAAGTAIGSSSSSILPGPDKVVVIMRGLPGAGKSTRAAQIAADAEAAGAAACVPGDVSAAATAVPVDTETAAIASNSIELASNTCMDVVLSSQPLPGLPARAAAPPPPAAVIHSTDSYFIDPATGLYSFNPELLSVNHQRNFDAFCKSLTTGVRTVIVDNTNIQPWQFEKYVTAAWAAGYKVREEVVGEFGEAAAAEYAARNVHGVPHDKILMMLDQWQQ